MGNNVKGITLEIGGNTTGLTKALADVNKETNKIQKELNEVNRLLKLDPTNVELLAQKQQLLTKATEDTKTKLEALKIAKSKADDDMSKGTEVNQEQYRKLQREIASSESKVKSLETQTKEMGTSSKKSIDNASKSAENFGEKAEKAGNKLKSIAGKAAIVATAVTAGFGVLANKALDNADEIQRQADVTGLSAERVQELSYAGQNLGVDLDTITGAQAKLTKSMLAGEKGTGTQAEIFKKLGVSVVDSNGNLRDAKIVMGEAFEALGKVGNETERDAMAMGIFGKSAMDLNPLIKAGKDGLSDLTTEAQNNGAVMSNEAVAGLDNFGDTLDGIKTSIVGSFGTALQGLLPQIQSLIQNIDMTKVKEAISKLAEIIIKLFAFILNNGKSILTIIGAIALGMVAWNVSSMIMGVVGAIKEFKLANEGATIGQWALNAAMSANPIGVVIIAVIAFVAAIVLLWNNCEAFRNFFIALWENIKAVVSAVVDFFINLFTVTIPNLFNSLLTFFGTVWQGIQNIFSGVGNWFANIFTGAWNNIKNIFSAVGGFFGGVWNTIKNVFTSIGSVIGDAIGGAFKTVINSILGFAENTINGFIRAINGAIGLINKIPGVDISRLSLFDIPQLANGGVLSNGSAIVAEAGPELIQMMNGKTTVTPLSKSSRNTAIDNGVGKKSPVNVTFNNQSLSAQQVISLIDSRLGGAF